MLKGRLLSMMSPYFATAHKYDIRLWKTTAWTDLTYPNQTEANIMYLIVISDVTPYIVFWPM